MNAVLILQLFPPTMVKSECSHVSSEMSYFYDLGKPGTFDNLNWILWDSRPDLFKIPNTQTVPGLLKYLPSVLDTNLMELLNVMSKEPCNTSQACPQIMDEEGKGQTWRRAENKKTHTPTWEAVMRESGRLTENHLKRLVHCMKCYNRLCGLQWIHYCNTIEYYVHSKYKRG